MKRINSYVYYISIKAIKILRVQELSKEIKRLMDTDNSIIIARRKKVKGG